ncbi:hypothetical protein HHL16_13690 [Pseudoflavitalea sp. G-6-1-2]|uniref:hypothetical protein n=1 Tax=Pseudoflavitalea sp. G-6-1-2 TaxID=2728841 RepID=UPI00146D08A8|nr:hypothetical protein [Pseudoflavitalea sp. G-6-1-2]NML21936.1 hypothetical protein [Pseudoflavitalea sp. G-6-1-2]
MKNKVFISICLMICGFSSVSQERSGICTFLEKVLGTDSVKQGMQLEFQNDSLTLIDVEHRLNDKCDHIKWGANYVKINQDSSLIKLIKSSDPYFIYKNKCHTFIFDSFKKSGSLVKFSIHQPCSGVLVEVIARWKKEIKVISVTRLIL